MIGEFLGQYIQVNNKDGRLFVLKDRDSGENRVIATYNAGPFRETKEMKYKDLSEMEKHLNYIDRNGIKDVDVVIDQNRYKYVTRNANTTLDKTVNVQDLYVQGKVVFVGLPIYKDGKWIALQFAVVDNRLFVNVDGKWTLYNSSVLANAYVRTNDGKMVRADQLVRVNDVSTFSKDYDNITLSRNIHRFHVKDAHYDKPIPINQLVHPEMSSIQRDVSEYKNFRPVTDQTKPSGTKQKEKKEDDLRVHDPPIQQLPDQVVFAKGSFEVNGKRISLPKSQHLRDLFEPNQPPTIPPTYRLKDNVKYSGETKMIHLTAKHVNGKEVELSFLVAGGVVFFRTGSDQKWILYSPQAIDLSEYRVLTIDGKYMKLSDVIQVKNNLQTVGDTMFYDTLIIRNRGKVLLSVQGEGMIAKNTDLNSIIYINRDTYPEPTSGRIPQTTPDSGKQSRSDGETTLKREPSIVPSEPKQPTPPAKQPSNTTLPEPQRPSTAPQPSSKQSETRKDVEQPTRSKELNTLYTKLNPIDRKNVIDAIQNLLNGKYVWIWFGLRKGDLKIVQDWFKENFEDRYILRVIEDRGERVRVRVDPNKQPKPRETKLQEPVRESKPQSQQQTPQTMPIPDRKQNQQTRIENPDRGSQSPTQTPKPTEPKAEPVQRSPGIPKGTNVKPEDLLPVPKVSNIRDFSDLYADLLKSRKVDPKYLERARELLSKYSESAIYSMMGLNPDQMSNNLQMLARIDRLTGRKELTREEHLAIVLMAAEGKREVGDVMSTILSPGKRGVLRVEGLEIGLMLKDNRVRVETPTGVTVVSLDTIDSDTVPVVVVAGSKAEVVIVDLNRLDVLADLQARGNVYVMNITQSDREVNISLNLLDRIELPKSTEEKPNEINNTIAASLEDVLREVRAPEWIGNVMRNVEINPDRIDSQSVNEDLEDYYSPKEIEMLRQIYNKYFSNRLSWEDFSKLSVYYFQKPTDDIEVK